MTLLESEKQTLLTSEQLCSKNIVIHEFILNKDPHAVDVQIAQICELAPLHPLTIEDCRKGNQRAKLEHYPDYLFFVLHYFDHDLSQITELHVVLRKGAILLIADNLPPSETGRWSEFMNLSEGRTLAEHIHNIFDCCVDSAERRVGRLEDLVSQAESLIVKEQFNPKLIVSLKQHTLRFQRSVSGTLSVVREFTSIADLTVEQKLWYRNVLDHQERLRHELEFLHSEMIALFDVFWGASGYYANEQIKRLTLLATIVVPLSFWTSFFGMNFETMPFKERWFFVTALTIMLGSVGGIFFYLKRRGLFRRRTARLHQSFAELLE